MTVTSDAKTIGNKVVSRSWDKHEGYGVSVYETNSPQDSRRIWHHTYSSEKDAIRAFKRRVKAVETES